ncbi:transporter, YbiR family [Pyrobaculum islandicum DSM 4184]|uniref:Transporter, YbiR family n=1 Tax=Pyrobaculum islandicum (strain DSM 4184 / JCM 9189 / GEO3) TaxID=384616 RepID=A1RVS6_PYRIL|nr:SLC13 family permease [Pyrobaculum islandicum]ABL89058.1 transporter, YbiR family [Pyrobaculum islandicum DSM 4184]
MGQQLKILKFVELMYLGEIYSIVIIAVVIIGMLLRPLYPKLPVWSLMSLAAFIAIVPGPLSIDQIPSVVNFEVLFFLVGMFSIVALAESSGLLDAVAYWFLGLFKSRYGLAVGASLLFGFLAAVAVNDTVALMGPPIAAVLARAAGLPPKFAFLLLAYSLTIGSVMTPVGNPQNMLIAVTSGIQAPFIAFFKTLALPTLINLVVTPLILAKMMGVENGRVAIATSPWEAIRNRRDAAVAAAGLTAAVAAMVANDVAAVSGAPHIHNIGLIPFVVATFVYFLASDPRDLLSRVDWGTILFFTTMFIAMKAVWDGGVLQPIISAALPTYQGTVHDMLAITALSLGLSQILSNVPFVNLFSAYLMQVGADERAWLTLAMASTIAGNLTLLGAASNIIILEVLEKKYHTSVSFTEFLKYGAVVTAVNIAIYLPFLLL